MLSRALLFILILGLVGCGDNGADQVALELSGTQRRLKDLQQELDAGGLRNALLIERYAAVVTSQKPELSDLCRAIVKDASTQAPMYQGLLRRFESARDDDTQFANWQERVAELQTLQSAADLAIYDDALSDSVNVLADLSDGQLSRVKAISKEAEQEANKSESRVGSQYVGNHHYGHWGSSGAWLWLPAYAYFGSAWSRPYYYSDWSYRRPYSYYHDYGRGSYSSRKDLRNQKTIEQRTRKSFSSKGKQFSSPYAKQRSGASALSRNSQQQSKSVFKSQYAKSSSSASSSKSSSWGSSSQRNSASRTSSGSFRGK